MSKTFDEPNHYTIWIKLLDRSILHCVSEKVPTFTLSITLSNVNGFSKFLHAGKRMKFATKPFNIIRLTLEMLLQYLGKVKI